MSYCGNNALFFRLFCLENYHLFTVDNFPLFLFLNNGGSKSLIKLVYEYIKTTFDQIE